MHKLKPKTKNTVANRKGNLPKEAKGWKVVDERVKYAISLIEGIDRKIDVQGETTGVIAERTSDIVARNQIEVGPATTEEIAKVF